MSALAKVFVVFVFILSVAFFGASATLFQTRHDWKVAYNTVYSQTEEKFKEVDAKIRSLTSQVDEKEKAIYELRTKDSELAQNNSKLIKDLNDEKKRTESLMIENNNAKLLNETLGKNLEVMTKANENLQKSLDKVKTDLDGALTNAEAAVQARDSMRLDLEKSQQELHRLRTEMKELTDKFESAGLQLASYRQRYPNDPIPGIEQPVEGLVTAVDDEEKLVVLSVGKDDKVEPGYTFTISRGNKFVGKVQIMKVFPNLSGAKILFTKDGEAIAKGDKAQTDSAMKS